MRQQYEGVGSSGKEPRTKAGRKEAEQRHNDCLGNLPPWCEWGERGEPARWEIMRSVARGYLLSPNDAVMILLMRERFSPVSERHRIDLLSWARDLYNKGMERCYAVVAAMGDDSDAGHPDGIHSANLDDEYDDAQFERYDAEDIVYGVANAPVDRSARPEDLDFETAPPPDDIRHLLATQEGERGFDPVAAKVALRRYAVSQFTTDLPVENVVSASFDARGVLRVTFGMRGGGIETFEFLKGKYGSWPFWTMRQRDRGAGRLVVHEKFYAREHSLEPGFEFVWKEGVSPSEQRDFALAQNFDW